MTFRKPMWLLSSLVSFLVRYMIGMVESNIIMIVDLNVTIGMINSYIMAAAIRILAGVWSEANDMHY